jgi:hypothetical protein
LHSFGDHFFRLGLFEVPVPHLIVRLQPFHDLRVSIRDKLDVYGVLRESVIPQAFCVGLHVTGRMAECIYYDVFVGLRYKHNPTFGRTMRMQINSLGVWLSGIVFFGHGARFLRVDSGYAAVSDP